MSENINNREYRKEVIKEIIKELHQGKTVDEVKQKFEEAFTGVTAKEISEAEQALIKEGLPISEVQRLCDVHAEVFKGSIEEIHSEEDPSKIPGHPANILNLENRKLENIIKNDILPYAEPTSDADIISNLKNGINDLWALDIHYSKKENLLFPYMEKYGIDAPPKVMWGVDDEIRAQYKEIKKELESKQETEDEFKKKILSLTNKIEEMIFKEESIMLPMLFDTLTEDEWKHVADESSEIGFIIDNIPVWTPKASGKSALKEMKKDDSEGTIKLPTGIFKTEELVNMLNTLPFDITFVDKNDTVKYFSQSAERIFARTKTIIGRNVSNCHPPNSVHIVEKIVEDFKSGAKDHEDFWIKMGDKYILIRYFAVRDENGEYLGVVEVTQDINPIQDIAGEKRLMS